MKVLFPKNFFVTGIGTDVGKTLVSAVLCKALGAEYWKPVQAGGLDFSDSNFIEQFGIRTHAEAYRLQTPASPHYAAKVDGVEICIEGFSLPTSDERLLVEGAGGVMVPLNEQELILDLILHLDIPAVLVSRNYLGSINHTLLSCEMLHAAGVEILGIIFNGEPNEATEKFILNYTNLNCLGRIPQLEKVSHDIIENLANELKQSIQNFFSL